MIELLIQTTLSNQFTLNLIWFFQQWKLNVKQTVQKDTHFSMNEWNASGPKVSRNEEYSFAIVVQMDNESN